MKELHDHYFHLAKKEGYFARSVYKLIEANEKYHFIKPGNKILDLGAYPGSWSQYALKKVGDKGLVVGLDLSLPKITAPNFYPFAIDVFSDFLNNIADKIPFDVVLSDMAPKTTGNKTTDHARSVALCERALEIARMTLKDGGYFYCKIFQGSDLNAFLRECKRSFKETKIVKPKSSRKESFEIFILGVNYIKSR